ncbi:MAG: transposase [Okeania sp. SIO2D1]|nr:transposase [Okeania sp. SIO2D1]
MRSIPEERKATREILSSAVTTNDISDDAVFSDLLGSVEGDLVQVSGDGAYDKRKCYDTASKRGEHRQYHHEKMP